MEEYNVPTIVFMLQSATSSLDERVIALRFLKNHLEENRDLDSYNRKRIKQLILDNILKILLTEDRTTSLQKRQLVRTELLLLLSTLLNSNVLFGNIINNPNLLHRISNLHEDSNERHEIDGNESVETGVYSQQTLVASDVGDDWSETSSQHLHGGHNFGSWGAEAPRWEGAAAEQSIATIS